MIRRANLLAILLILLLVAGCASLVPSHLSEKDVTGGVKEEVDLSKGFDDLSYHRDQVLLRVKPGANLQGIASSLGTSLIREWDQIGWALFQAPVGERVSSFLDRAMKHQDVLYGQPDIQFDFIEPVSDNVLLEDEVSLEGSVGASWFEDRLWGMKDIRADEAWDMGYTGSDKVIVAVVDTGVKMDHEAFANNTFVAPYNATHDGWEGGASDFNGHGTHVAATAVNDGRAGKLAGVSWDSLIMPVRAMDTDGVIYTSYLIESMIYVAEYAAANPDYRAVVNMSIGGRGYNVAFKDAIDYASYCGVLLVTSAGNSYKRIVSFPSSYNGVVSVAATTPGREKAVFSTTGWWNSVGAPGTQIWSAVVGEGEDEYAAWQGTSMASPHVAGAVALLLSKYPDLTPLEIKNQLEQTARSGAYGPGFSEEIGYGIIDVVDLLDGIRPLQYGSLWVRSNIEYGIVSIFDSAGNLAAFGATGFYEDHEFHALKPGNYTVTLSYAGYVYEKENVSVSIGEETVIDLDIDEDVFHSILFIVEDEAGDDLEGAYVEVGQGMTAMFAGYTGIYGVVEFVVPTGEDYWYYVEMEGYAPVLVEGVAFTEDTVVEVVLEEAELYEVLFYVADPMGNPLEDVYVDLYFIWDPIDYGITDADGLVALYVAPGSYFSYIYKDGYEIIEDMPVEVEGDMSVEVTLYPN